MASLNRLCCVINKQAEAINVGIFTLNQTVID